VALLARLTNRLALWTGGARDLPARQQTLRNTIAWSYDLLSADEQALFRRLGIFVGGCTVEAAEAVLRAEGRGLSEESPVSVLTPQLSVLDGLAALVDKSLLRREEGIDGEPRFVMLETVREYALERLAEIGEEEVLRRRHAEYFVALAEMAEAELWGPQQVEWLQRLEIEHGNLRAALDWSHGGEDRHDIAVRLAVALGWFWLWRGYRQEGYLHLKYAVDSATEPTKLRARALNALGTFALESDIIPARALFEESLAISRALGDVQGQADALYGLGWVADLLSGAPPPDSYFDECLALYQQIGSTLGIARVLGSTGGRERYEASLALYRSVGHLRGCADVLTRLSRMAHHRGDDGDAIVLLHEALKLYRELEDDGGVLWVLLGMSDIHQVTGDYERAEALAEESIVLARQLNDRLALAWALNNLGEILLQRNEFIQTGGLFNESLEIFREMGYPLGIWLSMLGRARIAVATGKVGLAVRLCASIEAVSIAQDDPPSTWPPEHCSHYERAVAAGRAQLDEEAFAAAWAAGRAMTIEQAIAYALSEDS
jgi:tetratricopeptide (TPR) repeat protein